MGRIRSHRSSADQPSRRFMPREEHLIPLMIAAATATDEPGQRVFADTIMGATTSAIQFGGERAAA